MRTKVTCMSTTSCRPPQSRRSGTLAAFPVFSLHRPLRSGGEPEESKKEGDVKSDEEEAELVKPDLPASKDLTNEHNKLAEPEAIVVVEDVDDHDSDELEGLQVAAQVEKESKDSLD